MLKTLPVELLIAVVKRCEQRSKACLARCCHLLNGIAIPELYMDVELTYPRTRNFSKKRFIKQEETPHPALKLSRILDCNDIKSALVRSVTINFHTWFNSINSASILLPRLPRLEKLAIEGSNKVANEERTMYHWNISEKSRCLKRIFLRDPNQAYGKGSWNDSDASFLLCHPRLQSLQLNRAMHVLGPKRFNQCKEGTNFYEFDGVGANTMRP